MVIISNWCCFLKLSGFWVVKTNMNLQKMKKPELVYFKKIHPYFWWLFQWKRIRRKQNARWQHQGILPEGEGTVQLISLH